MELEVCRRGTVEALADRPLHRGPDGAFEWVELVGEGCIGWRCRIGW